MSKRETDFLHGLLDTHKVKYRDQGREHLLTRRNYEQNPFYDALKKGYSELEQAHTPADITRLDLADFIMDRLPRLKNYHGGADYTGLRRPLNAIRYYTEHPSPQERLLGAYNPEAAIIKLYPHYRKTDNPLLTLLHEGTHGLDHLFMRSYQLPAVTALNYAQRDSSPHFSMPDILEGTKSILGDPRFKDKIYSYDRTFGPDIQQSFKELSPLPPAPPISDFYGAREKLFDLRKQHTHPSAHPFQHLSELTAYGTENLPYRWNVNEQTNPYSARLMHNVMGAEQRSFQQLGLNPQEHPGITGAFNDRLAQLSSAMQRREPQTTGTSGMGAGAVGASAGGEP